ncbi:MAG: MgtC/SapB family protein [Candidatus Diapherotrites archaeon]
MVTELDIVLRLLLAVLFGAVIGFEREVHLRPAGLRTHILVCMGAALFTISSLSIGGPDDPARIAAGIVTGIGFLGAGAIFHFKDHTIGLTTAADLWVVAAIGLATGAGYFFAGAVATFLVWLTLFGGEKLKTRIDQKALAEGRETPEKELNISEGGFNKEDN